jgi:hypothetical protein
MLTLKSRDPASPTLAQRYVYQDFGFSPANIDHRAISFHADRSVVAFPFRNYSTGENTLEIFAISTDATPVRLGGMGDGAEISLEQCLTDWGWDPESIARELEVAAEEPGFESELLWACNQGAEFRRGLFRDDVVYGISTGGVYAYDLDALDAGPLGEVSLPAATWDYRAYGDDGGEVILVDLPPQSRPASMGGGSGGADCSGGAGGWDMTSGGNTAGTASMVSDAGEDDTGAEYPSG